MDWLTEQLNKKTKKDEREYTEDGIIHGDDYEDDDYEEDEDD